MICSNERSDKFPFDVQHRNILKYDTEAPQDFERLKNDIITRLKALLQKENNSGEPAYISSAAPVDGLEQFEIATLVATAQSENYVSDFQIHEDMEKDGFRKISTTLGIRGLLEKGLIESSPYKDRYQDESGYHSSYRTVYRTTKVGMDWLSRNAGKIKLKADPANM